MILGSFDKEWGRPWVQGRLFLPSLHLIGDIDFLVDSGSDATTLHPKDGLPMELEYSELSVGTVPYDGFGGTQFPSQELAIMMFVDGRLLRYYEIPISIPRPEDHNRGLPSVLGQDILKHWRMVHDKPADKLTFTVRFADLTRRGSINDIDLGH